MKMILKYNDYIDIPENYRKLKDFEIIYDCDLAFRPETRQWTPVHPTVVGSQYIAKYYSLIVRSKNYKTEIAILMQKIGYDTHGD